MFISHLAGGHWEMNFLLSGNTVQRKTADEVSLTKARANYFHFIQEKAADIPKTGSRWINNSTEQKRASVSVTVSSFYLSDEAEETSG